ncbi:MAG TPA: TonB-dependent receptor [Pyrinomonadaceae bacterium]|nr:TonB-dependent receptor [Pyrinomonadaceae bacterium]
MKNLILFAIMLAVVTLSGVNASAQKAGTISGQVFDSLGAVVVGANVIVVDSAGKEKTAVTNKQGEFSIAGLSAGNYTVRVIAPKFSLYEQSEVAVASGEKTELTVALSVEGVSENVEINGDNQVDNDPNNNQSQMILKDKDLEGLPDNEEELEAALQALAGPSSGPNGGQIYIDGFTGGRLPPKDTIREIRINQNPFSAEYDRLGFGRIEIFTKPGSDRFRGNVFGNFNDESLNSRNPFATNRASSQTRMFGGNVSGPLMSKKASWGFDISNRQVDNGALINATILDPAFNVTPFQQELTVPTRRFSLGPRIDYAINDKNTLVARYSFSRNTTSNQGIGGFSLPTRAYETSVNQHELRLTETAILNAKTVNETRFSYEVNDREQVGDNTIPTINVSNAFNGGGAQIGLSYNKSKEWELQNYTSTTLGKKASHSIKFGIRLQGQTISDRSENGFGGSFTFPGFFATGDPYDLNADGVVSGIEQYRAKLLGAADTRYNPTQFSITSGNPLAKVSQIEVGAFITDDWRVRQDLTLGIGLRYENQTNIDDDFNFAPRFSFAWSPGAGGAKQPKTVIRGGFGVFYDRFSENYTLNALRFDGTRQLNYVVSANDPDPVRQAAAIALLSQPIFALSGVTNVPTSDQIGAIVPFTTTLRQVAPELKSSYTLQTALGIERQLPFKTTMAIFYVGARNNNLLRARNINAPVCPAATGDCTGGIRPDPAIGNILQYESTGKLTQHQVIFNFRTQISARMQVWGNYRLGFAKSDSDGANSFPAYTWDLTGEYGTASLDVRHNVVVGGSFTMPWNIRLSPFIIASSGRPFNITTGVDSNGDNQYTERPTFAQLAARCGELGLTNSFCDTSGYDPNAIIPRNFGRGPSFFNVNLNLSKTFSFGGERNSSSNGQSQQQGGGNRGGGIPGVGGGGRGGRGGMVMGGGGGMFGGGGGSQPYNLTFGVQVSNLFNTVNMGTPIGSLNTSRFGQSTSTAGGFGFFGGGGASSGNRRIELQARFSW